MWVHAKNMKFNKITQMIEDEIFDENLSLFIRNHELNNEFTKKEIENIDLLGHINDLKENQKCLKLFIKKIKEDEIDTYLSEISVTKELRESRETIKKLEKYNKYLKNIIYKCINIGNKINEIINGEKLHFDEKLNNETEESFRENLRSYLNIAELLFVDIKEKIKYQDKYKKLRTMNCNLKNKIAELSNTKICKKITKEISLNINEKEEKFIEVELKDEVELPLKEEGKTENLEKINYNLDTKNNEVIDIKSEIECLNYLVRQYKKENYELKQKLFEYEFNNVNNTDLSSELELKEKQREIEELEKEYSNWVMNLQEENSELREVINIQEEEQSKLIKDMRENNEKKIKELEEFQLKLIDDYETKLGEKIEELYKLKNNIKEDKEILENECLKRKIEYLEEDLKVLSNENQTLNVELEQKIKELEESCQRLIVNDKTIKQIKNEFENLKLEKNGILERYNHEKALHDKFEEEAHSLKKELDNVLSEMYKNNQKKTRLGIINDMESDKLNSLENIIKHCKNLENKIDELNSELEQYKNKDLIYNEKSVVNGNNAEIDTLFDQIQKFKNEREQLKKDIRQRDWAKVEIEILHKRTIEEIDQLKRDNTRLMLENLRLRDLSNISHISKIDLNFNNENTQPNSLRSSISTSQRNSIQSPSPSFLSISNKVSSEINLNEKKNNTVSKNNTPILNLKAPRRPSLLLNEKAL